MNVQSMIVGLLGVVFVTLKLLGVIDWSWWLVTLPFWGGAVVGFILLIGMAMVVHSARKRHGLFR